MRRAAVVHDPLIQCPHDVGTAGVHDGAGGDGKPALQAHFPFLFRQAVLEGWTLEEARERDSRTSSGPRRDRGDRARTAGTGGRLRGG